MPEPLNRQSVMEWLKSLSDEEFGKFRREFRAELARRGLAPAISDDRGTAQPLKRPGRRYSNWFGLRKD